jgi:hypothetical protein
MKMTRALCVAELRRGTAFSVGGTEAGVAYFRAIEPTREQDAWYCIQLLRQDGTEPPMVVPTSVPNLILDACARAGTLRTVEAENDPVRHRFHGFLSSEQATAWQKNLDIVNEILKKERRWLVESERPRYLAELLKAHPEWKEKTVRWLMSRFYVRGACPQALIDCREQKGGKGKKRSAKRRLHISGSSGGSDLPVELPAGDDLSQSDLDAMDYIIETFVLTSNRPLTQKEAYRLLIRTYFSLIIGDPIRDYGQLQIVIAGPSLDQFKRRCGEQRRTRDAKLAVFGVQQVNQTNREKMRRANTGAAGPGDVYELDVWDVREIKLVSEIDRTLEIGSPFVYAFLDRCTGTIAGITASFRAECYESLFEALQATMMPKSEYCARYGLAIDDSAWPISGPCSRLVCDRGPARGKKLDAWPAQLGIDVVNLGPRRPDWKPYVEGVFAQLLAAFVRSLPGALTEEDRARGIVAGRPVLTLRTFNALLIMAAMRYNLQMVPESAVPPQLRAAGVYERRRIRLYEEGQRILGAPRREFDAEQLRLSLMPPTICETSEGGLLCDGAFFENAYLHDRGMFLRATNQNPVKVPVLSDGSALGRKWMVLEDGARTLPLNLIQSHSQFENISVGEWKRYCKLIAEKKRPQGHATLLAELGVDAAIEQLTAHDAKATSKARRDEARELPLPEPPKQLAPPPLQRPSANERKPSESFLQLLRSRRRDNEKAVNE